MFIISSHLDWLNIKTNPGFFIEHLLLQWNAFGFCYCCFHYLRGKNSEGHCVLEAVCYCNVFEKLPHIVVKPSIHTASKLTNSQLLNDNEYKSI